MGTLSFKSFTYPIPDSITLYNHSITQSLAHSLNQSSLPPLSLYLQPSLSTVVSSPTHPGTKLSGPGQSVCQSVRYKHKLDPIRYRTHSQPHPNQCFVYVSVDSDQSTQGTTAVQWGCLSGVEQS